MLLTQYRGVTHLMLSLKNTNFFLITTVKCDVLEMSHRVLFWNRKYAVFCPLHERGGGEGEIKIKRNRKATIFFFPHEPSWKDLKLNKAEREFYEMRGKNTFLLNGYSD